MFIRAVQKKDSKKKTTYTYYRLTSSHRIGNKTRQTVILNLGKLEGVDKFDHKILANRIEEIISGGNNVLFSEIPNTLEELAQSFAKKIAKEKVFPSQKGKSLSKELESNYDNVDLDSIEQIESKDIGGEWLVKQAFKKLKIPQALKEVGLAPKELEVAQLLLK